MRPVSFEVVHQGPNITIGAGGALLVLLFRDEVSLASLTAAEAAQSKIIERSPGGTVLLTVIDATVPLPADGTRRMVADTFKKMAARNKAAATTIFGDGFWASAMRSTLTALNLVVRPPCPQKTFAELHEALTWLGSFEPDVAPHVARLAVEIEAMRGKPSLRAGGE